ncbi:MAG: dihydropteroate synthase [Phycisphaerales bacterium]|nr:dihydropteroate synthase [Phycisphaerales bacterium]
MDPIHTPTWTLSDTRAIDLDRPCVVCIVNATPDSFSDGGQHNTLDSAMRYVERAIRDGADMLDIGGESTRPGAERVGVEEQINRVVPIIEALRKRGVDLPISIDTTLGGVASAALSAGADAINDVSAMTEDPEMLPLAASAGCGVVLMHRLVAPDRDSFSDQYQDEPVYEDVVSEVGAHLRARAQDAQERGVDPSRIVLDPGLGFGKSVEDNLRLIRGTHKLAELGYPVMSGLSRKSFVGRIALDRDSDPSERVRASVGMSVAHLLAGARIFRVHDVAEHRQALDAAWGTLRYV